MYHLYRDMADSEEEAVAEEPGWEELYYIEHLYFLALNHM